MLAFALAALTLCAAMLAGAIALQLGGVLAGCLVAFGVSVIVAAAFLD